METEQNTVKEDDATMKAEDYANKESSMYISDCNSIDMQCSLSSEETKAHPKKKNSRT